MTDVLDQFSANAPAPASAQSQSQPPPQTSKDTNPSASTQQAEPDVPSAPDGPRPGESEEAFIQRLTSELSSAMSQMADDGPDDVRKASPEELAKMGKEIEAFTLAMEKEGIQPEDLLKAILGEKEGGEIAAAAHKEADSQHASPAQSKSRTASPETSAKSPPPVQDAQHSTASFEDTIRRTMARMESSSAAATSASTQSATSEEDMLAELLKTLGTGDGASGGDDSDELSNLFLKMMQELTKKDVLYDPMRDLNSKYPDYLAQNRNKLKAEDRERYEKQVVVVKEIVDEFEKKGYSDEDEGCRERIWEKMQTMQELGAPPEELVQSPMPGMGGGLPGMGAEGCPTQ
jgi:peroxin-19